MRLWQFLYIYLCIGRILIFFEKDHIVRNVVRENWRRSVEILQEVIGVRIVARIIGGWVDCGGEEKAHFKNPSNKQFAQNLILRRLGGWPVFPKWRCRLFYFVWRNIARLFCYWKFRQRG
ncbi:MAG: hypothetical protein Athens071425_23 [Parcubacteria group bacterium Athens0714_25]|nr:MAG: hypothetical protein Athens071425_23 [Parcubacteria group bacterium Athens0714_25]